jgi:ferritin-like metal-binding protein YciE
MKSETLENLLKQEVLTLHSAEQHIAQRFARLARVAASDELQKSLEDHARRSKSQADQLQGLIKNIDVGDFVASGCRGIFSLLDEVTSALNADLDRDAVDSELALAAARIKQYQAAGYAAAKRYATALKQSDAVRVLDKSISEETQTHSRLTALQDRLAQLT